MRNTLNTYEITDALLQDENAAWSYNGAGSLAEYLEEYEEACGVELELDVVALRCEFSEYASLEEWLTEYYGKTLEEAFKSAGVDLEGDEDECERDDLIRSHILDHGQLIEFDGGIIVSSF
jgi:hypothetical protein